ncbi:MAG: glycosyltransferase [Myxococcota bacterium]|nr:glycosyltransferase [Myxococcota bacterium]MDW8362253.1 glycosyltransferase [Myxococcales bacterium]
MSRSLRLASSANVPSWPARVAILNDYVRIPYANGSSFASQFLHRELRARGVEVTVLGPADAQATPDELPPSHLALPSIPLRNHPGVHLPLPSRAHLHEVARRRFDVVLGQSTSELMELGVWLRAFHDVPFVCVNTVHLPSVYNVLLPDALHRFEWAHAVFRDGLVPYVERVAVDVYNRSDGLVVLSEGLARYWEGRGVRVPIFVIPRAVEPRIFDRAPGPDPFAPEAVPGGRLLCVCRHVREKGLARLIDVFARVVAPAHPTATLTLVGDGPDHDAFRARAERLGVAHRVFFPGEQPLLSMSTWYRHADVFVYASLSDTYGQVVSEAMWCGLPVVAFDDAMGVAQQVEHGRTGVLVAPGPDAEAADREFGEQILRVLQPARRRALGEAAARRARHRCDPGVCVERYFAAFAQARRHCEATAAERARARTRGHEIRLLGRWAFIHVALGGLGLLRPPARLNRNGARPPGWTALPDPVPVAGLQPRRVTSREEPLAEGAA